MREPMVFVGVIRTKTGEYAVQVGRFPYSSSMPMTDSFVVMPVVEKGDTPENAAIGTKRDIANFLSGWREDWLDFAADNGASMARKRTTEPDNNENQEAKLVADRLIVFLEQQCDKCKGAGSLTSEAWAKWTEAFEYHRKQGQSVKDATDAVGAFPEGPEKVKCSACVGGKVPTQAGKKILDFVAKYQGGASAIVEGKP